MWTAPEVTRVDEPFVADERAMLLGQLRWQPLHVPPRHGDMSCRWVLVHLIEEYARHNGHADLLREHIDGVTGS